MQFCSFFLCFSGSRASRNKRTTGRANLDFANVVEAIKAVKLENRPVHAVARSYELPRMSLTRYVAKVSSQYEDISTVTDEELVETIKRSCSYAACAVKQASELRQTIELRRMTNSMFL